MKILYLDCGMGAAGDMMTAALSELLPDPDSFLDHLNSLGIPHVTYIRTPDRKNRILGTHISVQIGETNEENWLAHADAHTHNPEEHHHHDHRSLKDVHNIVSSLAVSDKVRNDILAVYALLAEAEGHVHGCPVSEIHFHEVGTMDAIADITAVCLLLEKLHPDEIVVSPIRVGSGTVTCAHGVLPVPAPATAELLKGIPIYSGEIKGELCTPTGAALLRYFATRFGELPPMSVRKIGYGTGTKNLPAANCLRAILGEDAEETDAVYELSLNVDDMTAEEIGFAMDKLFEAGALEVYTVPVGMKKNRPGTMIRVLCRAEKKDCLIQTIFRHTSTIGLREYKTKRYTLHREETVKETPFGDVHFKHVSGYGVDREKAEYEDLVKIASETGLSLSEVRKKF